MKEKVLIGMSGGVDSSVAAYLLKEEGYEVIGVTMVMTGDMQENEDAKGVAEALGISHRTIDCRDLFREHVLTYFTEEYLQGRTPNPCNACNRYVKFETLLQKATKWGIGHIATGHYAKVLRLTNGRYTLKNADSKKDQTYALYALTQPQLQKILMPLGGYEKEEVRRIAEKIGLCVAHKPDSQDICFIPDGDYVAYLTKEAGERLPKEGDFVDMHGNVIGRHKGIVHYTVGQRKGLGLSMGHPVFVAGIHADQNEVIIGEDADIRTKKLSVNRLHFMATERIWGEKRALVKIRYAHGGAMAVLKEAGEDMLECIFDEPVRAATPGQAAVFYEDGHILGGGTIL